MGGREARDTAPDLALGTASVAECKGEATAVSCRRGAAADWRG